MPSELKDRIEQIANGNSFYIILGVVFVIGAVYLVVLAINYSKKKDTRRIDKIIGSMIIAAAIMIFGGIQFFPAVHTKMLLKKDLSNNLQTTVIYGTIENEYIYDRKFYIVIDDNRYILFNVDQHPDVGENCEIMYLKYSKYIIDLKVID